MFHTPDDKFIGVTISKPIAVQDNDCTFIKISIHLQIPQGMKVLSNRCLGKWVVEIYAYNKYLIFTYS